MIYKERIRTKSKRHLKQTWYDRVIEIYKFKRNKLPNEFRDEVYNFYDFYDGNETYYWG